MVSTIRPLPEPRQGNTVYVVEATIPNREFVTIEDAREGLMELNRQYLEHVGARQPKQPPAEVPETET